MSKHYGKQIRPDFPIVGWATVEDVKAGRKAQATLAKPKNKAKAKPVAAELDDELPEWGVATNRAVGCDPRRPLRLRQRVGEHPHGGQHHTASSCAVVRL